MNEEWERFADDIMRQAEFAVWEGGFKMLEALIAACGKAGGVLTMETLLGVRDNIVKEKMRRG